MASSRVARPLIWSRSWPRSSKRFRKAHTPAAAPRRRRSRYCRILRERERTGRTARVFGGRPRRLFFGAAPPSLSQAALKLGQSPHKRPAHPCGSATLTPRSTFPYRLGGQACHGHSLAIIIGFIAGVIAKFLMPGPNEPSGFILTTILGIVGAFVATFLGQAVGWYRAGEGAGLIGAVVGAVIVLAIWGAIARRRTSTY